MRPFRNLFGTNGQGSGDQQNFNLSEQQFFNEEHPQSRVRTIEESQPAEPRFIPEIPSEPQSASTKQELFGRHYDEMSVEEKYDSWLTDPKRRVYNYGIRVGYAFRGERSLKEDYMQYMKAEFKAILKSMISGKQKVIEDMTLRFMNSVESDFVKELLQVHSDRLKELREQVVLCDDGLGDVEYALSGFNTGFNRGSRRAVNDTMSGSYDDKVRVEIEKEGGEL